MKKKGFTLVELLVVVAILAILAVSFYSGVFDKYLSSKKSIFESDVKNIYNQALQDYVANNIENFASGNVIFDSKGSEGTKKLSATVSEEYYIVATKDGIVLFVVSDGQYVVNVGKSNRTTKVEVPAEASDMTTTCTSDNVSITVDNTTHEATVGCAAN